MSTVLNAVTDLLRFELGAEGKRVEATEELYAFSKHFDLAHLVADALFRQGLLGQDTDLGKNFLNQQLLAVYRYERMNFELTSVCGALEKAGIPFMPLKGAVMRGYYPEPWMRTSCDIDILVREEDVDNAAKLLQQTLDYRIEKLCSHDLSMFSPGGLHFELHYDTVEKNHAQNSSAVLARVWEDAETSDGSCHHRMSDEMFYFYHIAHMAKHFENGGCGIRPFLDIWILDHMVEHEKEKREALLEEGGLLKFARAARKLSEVWFSDAKHDELTETLQEYVLSGGLYGNKESRITVQQSRKGGKTRYILSRIFLPYDTIKFHHPILQKHRWLTPFYEVRRWFRIVFCGGMKRFLYEINLNNLLAREKAAQTTELLKELGL